MSKHMPEVRITKIKDLTQLKNEWEELERTSDCSFFQTWMWIGTWLSLLDELAAIKILRIVEGNNLLGLCVLGCKEERLKMLIPIKTCYINQAGNEIYDSPIIEHNGLLLKSGFEHLAINALSHYIQSSLASPDMLIIGGLAEEKKDIIINSTPPYNPGIFYRKISPYFYVNLLEITSHKTSYLQTRSKNLRYEINRSIRIYERKYGPVTIKQADTLDEDVTYYNDMLELHCRHWIKKTGRAVFQNGFLDIFHRKLLTTAYPEGYIQLVKITTGQVTVGYLYNFVKDGVVYAYQSGFNYSDDNKIKPGLVSHALAIQEALENHMEKYDFLAGNHLYKARLSSHRANMYWLELQKPQLKTRFLNMVRRLPLFK